MVRFVHTADLQLGMPGRFLTPEAQARHAQSRIDVIRAIGEVARREGAQFVVAAGDVFDSNHIDRQVVGRAMEAFAAIGMPVFLLPGNHDPLDAASVYRSAAFTATCPPNVVVLAGEPVDVAPGVQVVPAPWTSKRPVVDLAGRAVEGLAADGTTRVLVAHGSVDALFPGRTDPWLLGLDVLEGALARGAISYVALGDRHSTTSVGASGRVWYSGAPEATADDETDPGNVLVVTLDGDAVDVVPHRVGRWRFVRQPFALNSPADVDALDAWVRSCADKDRCVVRLELVGTLPLRERARLDALLDEHRPVFAALDVWAPATELLALPDHLDAEVLGLAGFARRAGEVLEADAGAGSDIAADALALLWRLSAADATSRAA